ncbi:MAG: hypothetical protein IPK82_39320 [Polyangiaceae bacterium]|nr:hypothetical protein [Polyangiaceae bacterium]
MSQTRAKARAVSAGGGAAFRFVAAFTAIVTGCGDTSLPMGDGGVEQDASIPSPIATEPPEPLGTDAGPPSDGGIIGLPADSSGRLIIPDAGAAPPEPLRADSALAPEPPGPKELAGFSLDAMFRWRDVPPATKLAETSNDGLKEANRLTSLALRVHMADGGRMRIEFASRALPLPSGTELRARADRWGHLLLWPNSTDYRVVPVGALRTLLGERRVDVTPLSPGQIKAAGDGKRLQLSVRKIEVTAPLGTLRIELGKVTDAPDAAPLLCRSFVEMVGVDPKTPACQSGEVPLFASWSWVDGGGIAWEATAITKRTDMLSGDFVIPPAGARYAASGLPIAPGGILLSKEELAAFRTGPLPSPSPPQPLAPGEGFIAVNQTDTLLYVLIDGVPVALVPAQSDRYVIGTTRSRYSVQWRTFLGEKILPASIVEMPARFVLGGPPDAGASDASK